MRVVLPEPFSPTAKPLAPRRRHFRLQVFVERGQVEIVLVHAADRRQARRHRRLALAKQRKIHGHLAERDESMHGADRYPGVGAVERGGAQQAKAHAPAVAPHGQCAIRPVELVEDALVAIQQAPSQAEELDLLGMVLARQHGFQVDLHARLGRTPAEQAKRIAGKLRLGHERRQPRQQQHRDGPGREPDEQHAVARQGHGVLRQAEAAHHERERPHRGLAARPCQLVVELGVLEMLQLQRQRLLQDHDVDALAQLGAQQRLAQVQAALGRSHDGDQGALQDDELDHPRGVPAAGADGCHDRVHDHRPDPGDAGRHHAGDDRQRAEAEGQVPVGAPDQFQRPPAVAKDAKETFQGSLRFSGDGHGRRPAFNSWDMAGLWRQPDHSARHSPRAAGCDRLAEGGRLRHAARHESRSGTDAGPRHGRAADGPPQARA
jgi:hypothetical protein